MVSSNVEKLRILHQLPDLGRLQVIQLVQVRSCQIRAQRAVVPGDDNTTATSGCLIVVSVFGADTSLCRDVLEHLAVLVFSDAADVDCGIGREHVLMHRSVSIHDRAEIYAKEQGLAVPEHRERCSVQHHLQ